MKNKRKTIEFYVGLIILILTLIYMINKSIIYSGIFYQLIIGRFSFYSILIVIPFTIGTIMLFDNKKSIFAKLLTIVGGALGIVSLVTCISIATHKFSISEYIWCGVLGIIGLVLCIHSFIEKNKSES